LLQRPFAADRRSYKACQHDGAVDKAPPERQRGRL